MKILFWSLVLIFSTFGFAIAQDSVKVEETEAAFYSLLKGGKVDYKVPKGYKKIFIAQNAHIGTILLSGSRHQLDNQKDSIFMYFSFDRIDTAEAYISKMKRFGFGWDMNKNYLQTQSDTVKFPIKRNSTSFTKNKYNADVSGFYELPLKKLYKERYSKCKVAFIHKENRADITLYFFYNPNKAATVSKHMAKVLRNIKFVS